MIVLRATGLHLHVQKAQFYQRENYVAIFSACADVILGDFLISVFSVDQLILLNYSGLFQA